MPKFYPNTYQHSDAYYLSVLKILIAGCKARNTHEEISNQLNEARVLTAIGKLWSKDSVKTQLARLRNRAGFPKTRLHEALLRLICNGQITTRSAMPLFQQNVKSFL